MSEAYIQQLNDRVRKRFDSYDRARRQLVGQATGVKFTPATPNTPATWVMRNGTIHTEEGVKRQSPGLVPAVA